MTQRQEHKLKAMNLPEKEEATVRAIVALLDKECGDDQQLKVRALSTAAHYGQAEGFFD